MDTICFFYRKRDLKEAWVEPIGLKSYMLIRVGLNVREGEWFGIGPDTSFGLKASVNGGSDTARKLSEDAANDTKHEDSPEREQSLDKVRGFWRRIFRIPVWTVQNSTRKQPIGKEDEFQWKKTSGNRKKLRRPQRDSARNKEAEEQERLQAERAEKLRRVEEDMKALSAKILELAGEESRCYAVYDDSIRKAVLKESRGSILPSLWHRHMEFEEFSGYTKAFWIGLLLPNAVLHHFVVLGTAPCVPEVIEKYAPRMRSLKWILSQEQCSPELLEFVEDFYMEYGLFISLQTLPGGGNLKALGVLCSLPSNILDFTGDSCVNIPETARGSVWLDFLSVEEKRRRIEGRCPGVSYFSLKEKWRHAQRRCKEPLLP